MFKGLFNNVFKTFIKKQFFRFVLKMGFDCFYEKNYVWKLLYNVKVSKVLFTFLVVAQHVHQKKIANISNLVSFYDIINNIF